MSNPLSRLRHHVTGAIERGEKQAIVAVENDEPVQRVILRRCKQQPQVVEAFFPDQEANPGCIVCYAHVGQHSEASLDYYRDSTTPLKDLPYDAQALLSELRSRGYNLRQVQRR